MTTYPSASMLACDVFRRASADMMKTGEMSSRQEIQLPGPRSAYLAHRAIVIECERLNDPPAPFYSLGLAVLTHGASISCIVTADKR